MDGNPLWVENPSPIHLTAAWIEPSSCQLPQALPTGIAAVRNFNDIYAFDGTNWQPLQDIPADQTITWIKGTASGHVLAVGYKDSVDNPGSHQGVIWQCDGSSCSDVTGTLFPGGEIPGLTDIDLTYSHQSCVHVGGFEAGESAEASGCVQPEPACSVAGSPGDCMTARLAAEDGKVVELDNAVLPDRRVDVVANLQLGGAPTSFVVRVTNDGPDAAEGVRIYVTSDLQPDSGCGFHSSSNLHNLTLVALNVGDVFSCSFTGPGPENAVGAYAFPGVGTERDYNDNAVGCSFAETSCTHFDARTSE
ncbi:MAG: hypothetical protein KDI75_06530 [Xanthomonadales bacterium]|nr:hypothetical protein [Xanthomonadales bacterium]